MATPWKSRCCVGLRIALLAAAFSVRASSAIDQLGAGELGNASIAGTMATMVVAYSRFISSPQIKRTVASRVALVEASSAAAREDGGSDCTGCRAHQELGKLGAVLDSPPFQSDLYENTRGSHAVGTVIAIVIVCVGLRRLWGPQVSQEPRSKAADLAPMSEWTVVGSPQALPRCRTCLSLLCLRVRSSYTPAAPCRCRRVAKSTKTLTYSNFYHVLSPEVPCSPV